MDKTESTEEEVVESVQVDMEFTEAEMKSIKEKVDLPLEKLRLLEMLLLISFSRGTSKEICKELLH